MVDMVPMSLLPTSMTTSLIQAAQARIVAFRRKNRSGPGTPGTNQDVEQVHPGIDQVDLAEASQKLVGDTTASRQKGSPGAGAERPPLRHVDLKA
ncbi:MAG: hypothetical protein CMJ36_04255 [Phycisphaerae bacterium]|nr:hypothetical protein [Phycisphaerae bacterium]